MSILQILAAVICLSCLVIAFLQLRRGDGKSVAVYLASAILSVASIFMLSFLNRGIQSYKTKQAVGEEQQAVQDARPPADFAPETADPSPLAEEDDSQAAQLAGEEVPLTEPEIADDGGEVLPDLNFGDMDDADESTAAAAEGGADEDTVEPSAEDAPLAADEGTTELPAEEDAQLVADEDTIEPPAEDAPTAAADTQAESVEPDPLAPKAVAGESLNNIKIKETVSFDGHKSKKKKAAIAEYHWDFGDGTHADGERVTHAYSATGTYTATLTVVDKDGHKATAQRTIDVSRPESKVRFVEKSLPNAVGIKKSPDDLTGQFTKQFSGSKTTLEAEASVVSTNGCSCSITAEIKGPGCNAKQTKLLKDGGEGKISVKATCHGEPGDYTWTFKRKANGCECTFEDVSLDGYES